MTAVVDGVVKLIKAEFGYDLLDALMGFESAEKVTTNLLAHASTILTGRKVLSKLNWAVYILGFILSRRVSHMCEASNDPCTTYDHDRNWNCVQESSGRIFCEQ